MPALKAKSPGSIFVPCMISGLSTRKGDLPGKILTPCIQNHPIAPGNGRIGRGSCHSYLEKHTFRANIARKRAYCVHSSKRERIRCDFLPGDAVKQLQHEGWMRASWGSAAGVADAAEGCYRGGCCGDGSVRVTARRRTAYARCGRRTFAAMVHRRLNSGSNGGGRAGAVGRREWLP